MYDESANCARTGVPRHTAADLSYLHLPPASPPEPLKLKLVWGILLIYYYYITSPEESFLVLLISNSAPL